MGEPMVGGRLVRSRWAAIGAAVAVTLGFGGIVGARAALVATPGTLSAFEPLPPARILDTRTGLGVPQPGPLGAGEELVLTVHGAGGVPDDASSVVLNLTATGGTAPSFITAYPDGQARPEASVLNVQPGVDTPNMITATLGTDGRLRIYNNAGSVHVVADVAGYYHGHDHGAEPAWVRVDVNGTMVAGNLFSNIPRQSVGFYKSTTIGSFIDCGWTATVNADPVTSTARMAVVDRGAFPTDIEVFVYDANGALVDAGFTLVRVCPTG